MNDETLTFEIETTLDRITEFDDAVSNLSAASSHALDVLEAEKHRLFVRLDHLRELQP